MASLEGLPPLPKSLSGLNLLDYNAFQPSTSPYSVASDHSTSGGENNFSRSYSLNSENGNFVTSAGRNYSMSSTISSENIIMGRSRKTPPMRDVTPSLSFKQLPETPPMSSTRASPVIHSSRNTPHSSSRGSPIIVRGSTSPAPVLRGATPPMPSLRSLPPPTPPPRQNQLTSMNGIELPGLVHVRPGRLFNLDAQLATLRKEMVIINI